MGFITKPVLTVDIVNYSLMNNTTQIQSFRMLVRMLNQAIPKEHNLSGRRIWSPAGDGGSLTFWDDIHAALQTAVALGQIINEYNKNLPEKKYFQVRMGLHSGIVIKEVDFDERENVWGNGINISNRVMSMAKPGQIMASKDFCSQADLFSRTQEVTYVGKWWPKHNKPLELYNIYIDNAGLPPSEVDEWYGPFHYPLQQAMETYSAMIENEKKEGPAFRVAVLCKRLLDLEPSNTDVQQVLESISERRFNTGPGAKNLYDSFFSKLSPSALVYFFRNGQFKAFQKDSIIAKEGARAESMMMVVSGEIFPSIHGNPLNNQRTGSNLVLREGAIIGEMGLFSPGGTRTATLKASKNTISLTLDYRFLRSLENASDTQENLNRMEIQKRIWEYYRKRTIDNAISFHPLFQVLSAQQCNRLADDGNKNFLPGEHNQILNLSAEDIWEYITIVVGGSLNVNTKKDNTTFNFKADENLGAIRFVMSEDAECPFSDIELSPNTYLIRFSYNLIRDLANESENFLDECMKYGGREKRNLKLI